VTSCSGRRLITGAVLTILLAATAAPIPATGAEGAPAARAIAWRAFEAESFELARKERRLVLLSMPAPWGHWDRIMAETTFNDPRVVELIEKSFVPVRVDPLLRPDLFLRYGMGGWPTTAFLLPSAQPFYFPDAQRRIVRSGGNFYAPEVLATYLAQLAEYFAANSEAAEKSADELARGMLQRKEVGEAPLTRDMLEVTATKMMEAYAGLVPDPTVKVGRHPDVDAIELGLHYYTLRGQNREVLDVALRLLTDMARGGIRDQLGGGFHRFAADQAWRVPAFEKPLSVNAEMMQAYTDVYKVTGNALFLKVAEGIAGYVLGTLGDPEGWFYAYQAADARSGEDGDYYTWTLEEARDALGEEERALVLQAFDIGEWGEMVDSSPRRNVLFVQEGPKLLADRFTLSEEKASELLEAGRAKLLAARSRRTAPPVGKVLIVEANAAIGAALLHLGDARGRADLRAAGLKAIQFAWDKARSPESGLMDRAWDPVKGRAGLAELFVDQVQMVGALIAAHESTGEARWLDNARQLADTARKAFAHSLEGGWMDRLYAAEAPGLLSWPMRSLRDNALFAGSLLRLHHLTGEAAGGPYAAAARKALESWGDEFARYKEGSAPFGLAADRAQTPPLEVLLVGTASDAGYDVLEQKSRALYHPWKILRHVPASDAAALLAPRKMDPPQGAAALLCQADRCAGPFTSEDNLRDRLAAFLKDQSRPSARGMDAPSGPAGR
jgi:hypothetical protein